MFDGSKVPKETREIDIYDCLKNAGIDVYFQGQHKGHCTAPYVVIISRGQSKLLSCSSSSTTIEILCYVPVNVPSRLQIFVEEVQNVLKELKPMLKNSHNDIGDYVDDNAKAIMRTLQYLYYRKIED